LVTLEMLPKWSLCKPFSRNDLRRAGSACCNMLIVNELRKHSTKCANLGFIFHPCARWDRPIGPCSPRRGRAFSCRPSTSCTRHMSRRKRRRLCSCRRLCRTWRYGDFLCLSYLRYYQKKVIVASFFSLIFNKTQSAAIRPHAHVVVRKSHPNRPHVRFGFRNNKKGASLDLIFCDSFVGDFDCVFHSL
jgi:hypothetical protein